MAAGRILIVDDEEPVLGVLSEYFTTQGYRVSTAAGGAEALAALRRERPDLVLLDLQMPDVDGLEVLRQARELDATLPVVMVTANDDLAVARKTLELGAFDYVEKPFDYAALARVVAAGLARGRQAGSGR